MTKPLAKSSSEKQSACLAIEMSHKQERQANMSSTSEFGREIGLVHQIIMDAKRLGADERFWKSLVKNEEFLASVIDSAMFYLPPRIGFCFTTWGEARDFSLLCFSQSEWVSHKEATLRVERFGRFALEDELELLCKKFQELWDIGDCPPLQYPIVGVYLRKHPEYLEQHQDDFLAITCGEDGRPTLTKCDPEKQRRGIFGSFHWAPGTMFMALARLAPVKNVLESRLR